jgi:CheY-like chemotaxis protein
MDTKTKKKKLHILLADDDQDDRLFFREALDKVPIPTNLTTVENGKKLTDFLSGHRKELPDVLFLDINMPLKNGHECLSEIKQDKVLQHIPVVMYSTSLHDEVADVLYEKGAHYYLKKCEYTDLPSGIHQVLTRLLKNPARPQRNEFIIRLPKTEYKI